MDLEEFKTDDDAISLSFLDFDEIEYQELSEEVLIKLTLGNELYIATYALAELAFRNSKHVVQISWTILEQSDGDKYLQSTAIHILAEKDSGKAVQYMLDIIDFCEPLILNRIMEIILYYNQNIKKDTIREIALAINKRLTTNWDEEFEEDFIYEEKEVFLEFLKTIQS